MKTQHIFEAVEMVTKVDQKSITGKDRFKAIVFARHLFCYTCKEHTDLTLMQIGNFINRHHSTVISSLGLISDMIYIDDEVTKDCLNKINTYLKEKFKKDRRMEIILPYNADIEKINLYLKNEHQAKCVKTT